MSSQRVIDGLIRRGIPEHIALGIAGNLAVESGFDPGINEVSPIVPGSRGGFGLSQWTGPRRVQYEDFARSRGAGLADIDTQLDFMVWELGNTEKRAGEALSAAQTPEEAARIFSEKFLRPGIPHLDRRIAETRKLAGGSEGNALARIPASQREQQNALAPTRPNLQNALLDPRAFQREVRPVNRLTFT